MEPKEVLSFWFGDHPEVPWANAKMWFEEGRSLDPVVRTRFLPTIEAALRGDLDAWKASVPGSLA